MDVAGPSRKRRTLIAFLFFPLYLAAQTSPSNAQFVERMNSGGRNSLKFCNPCTRAPLILIFTMGPRWHNSAAGRKLTMPSNAAYASNLGTSDFR